MSIKRVLWLLNHTTLRKCEVPLLINMGYEVYCPNSFPYNEGNLSASVERKYDSSLTIPQDTINQMNQVNFYEDIPANMKEIINKYFDIVFLAAFPEQLYYLVNSFHGTILLHPFGLAGEMSYTDILYELYGVKIFQQLNKISNRFFFAQAYDNLVDIECDFFKTHAIHLPLGLEGAKGPSEWVGGDNKIFFVCPRIATSKYFEMIYRKFKQDFDGFDYVIGGAQFINVDDDRVLGYVSNEQHKYNMTHLSVMFYHSQESRHLHYHPLEAVRNGMPLVFMANGMLDHIGGEKLPGRCTTIQEARIKIKRIFNGDKGFIRKIIESQKVLLKKFDMTYCSNKWKDAFQKVEESFNSKEVLSLKKKIAIIVPAEYTGGVLDYALRFTRAVYQGAKEAGDRVELVLGYVDHPNYENKNYFKEINSLGIEVRKYKWQLKTTEELNNALLLYGLQQKAQCSQYIFCDGVDNFNDCDFWFFMADATMGQIFDTKPYVVLAHDYIQRYLPSIYKGYDDTPRLNMQRKACKVFVTSLPTFKDAINYGGLSEKQVALTPWLFEKIQLDLIVKTTAKKQKDYFYWSTNSAPHKNHKIMLEALTKYYAKGGTLKCFISGTNTLLFNPKEKVDSNNIVVTDYMRELRQIIKADDNLLKNIVFLGNMPKEIYLERLSHARFLIHPGYADNGNGTIIDAAFLGVPSVCSSYPAAIHMNKVFSLNMIFFDPFDSEDVEKTLCYMEKNWENSKKQLPSIESLEKLTISYTYKALYSEVRNLIF